MELVFASRHATHRLFFFRRPSSLVSAFHFLRIPHLDFDERVLERDGGPRRNGDRHLAHAGLFRGLSGLEDLGSRADDERRRTGCPGARRGRARGGHGAAAEHGGLHHSCGALAKVERRGERKHTPRESACEFEKSGFGRRPPLFYFPWLVGGPLNLALFPRSSVFSISFVFRVLHFQKPRRQRRMESAAMDQRGDSPAGRKSNNWEERSWAA